MEKFFREKEEKFLRRELQEDNIILSLGGGCCMNGNNAGIIKKESFCIFLNTPFETCYERISKNSLRPLATNNTQEKLREIYDGRLGRYMELADMTIYPNELSDDNLEKLAEKIKAELLKIQK